MLNELLCDLPTYERILYAAIWIVSQEGLKGLSASKLAELAGISKSTIFHHFKKMDDIPVLILEKLHTEIITPVQQKDHDSIRTYLMDLGMGTLSDNPQHIMMYKAFLSLYEASMHDASLREIVNTCSYEFAHLLKQKLESLSSFPIEESTINNVINVIFMSLDGIALNYLIHGDLKRAEKAWCILIDALVSQYYLE